MELIENILKYLKQNNISFTKITQEDFVNTFKCFEDYVRFHDDIYYTRLASVNTQRTKTSSAQLTEYEKRKIRREFRRTDEIFIEDHSIRTIINAMRFLCVPLSPEQRYAVIQICEFGRNTFVTGPAGSGKSHLIKVLKKKFSYTNKRIGLTATTGKAAIPIGGSTIHRFGGLGLGDKPVNEIVSQIYSKGGANEANNQLLARYRRTNVIFLDEVSMLSAELIEKFDQVACQLRRNVVPTEQYPDEILTVEFRNSKNHMGK